LSADGSDYLNGLTLFFVGYISLEVLWNLILKKIGPRIWLPLVGVVWGIVSTLQGCVVKNGHASGRAGFLAVRFFLGLTEGESYSFPLLDLGKERVTDRLVLLFFFRWPVSRNCVLPFYGKRALFAVPK
jgi:hypothetical protein